MFADIVGFTAWSSVREPSQVFSLLEALFRAFDDCASRRRVFKVSFQSPQPREKHDARSCTSHQYCRLKPSGIVTLLSLVSLIHGRTMPWQWSALLAIA